MNARRLEIDDGIGDEWRVADPSRSSYPYYEKVQALLAADVAGTVVTVNAGGNAPRSLRYRLAPEHRFVGLMTAPGYEAYPIRCSCESWALEYFSDPHDAVMAWAEHAGAEEVTDLRVVTDEEAAVIFPSLSGRPLACVINYGEHDWVLRRATVPDTFRTPIGTEWVACVRCGLQRSEP